MAKRGKLHGAAKAAFLSRMAAGRRKHHHNPSYKGKLSHIDFSQQTYRGYLIRTNALTGEMWIEKGGHLIHRIPRSKSWEYARQEIDKLIEPANNPGRASVHTAKFDRCVTDVKKSLRKRRRKGNAYAICGSRMPHAGVKKSHRRIKNMKPVKGAVIVVHLCGKHPYYYGSEHFLTSNRTAARIYRSVEHAKKHAIKLANELEATGTHARITLNKP